jgi:hypothetical protein
MAGVNEDGSIGMGGDDDGMEGLEGLMGEGDGDGDIDMIGADGGNRRRSLPSIRTDFPSGPSGSGGVQGGNPITPASGYTPNAHHNTYPPLGTPSNRTASMSGPSPAGLFPPSMQIKPNTPTSASPMQISMAGGPTPTPVSAVPGGNAAILSPHGNITDSPKPATPAHTQETSDSVERGRQMSGVQSTDQRPEGAIAPTANMGTPGPGNNFFTSVDGVFAYVKGLEDRVRHLEGLEVRVHNLEEELKQYRQQAQHQDASTDQQQLQQEAAQAS